MTWASWTSSLRTLPNGCGRKAMVSPLPNSSTTSWIGVIAWGWNLAGNYPYSPSSSQSADLTGINRDLSSFTTGTIHTLGRLPRSFGLPSTGAPRWHLVGQNESRPPILDLQHVNHWNPGTLPFRVPEGSICDAFDRVRAWVGLTLPKKGRGSWCFLALITHAQRNPRHQTRKRFVY
jgi:hypothetical protein